MEDFVPGSDNKQENILTFPHSHLQYSMDGDEPWQAPVREESSQTLLPQTFHSLQNDTVLQNCGLHL